MQTPVVADGIDIVFYYRESNCMQHLVVLSAKHCVTN